MEIARVYVRADLGRGKSQWENAIDAIDAAIGATADAAAKRRFGLPVTPVGPLSLFGSDMRAFESRNDYFQPLRLAKSFNDRTQWRLSGSSPLRAALPTI
jgi:hypothetical protein